MEDMNEGLMLLDHIIVLHRWIWEQSWRLPLLHSLHGLLCKLVHIADR